MNEFIWESFLVMIEKQANSFLGPSLPNFFFK